MWDETAPTGDPSAEAMPAKDTDKLKVRKTGNFWAQPMLGPVFHKELSCSKQPLPSWSKIRVPRKFDETVGPNDRCIRVFYAENPQWLYSDLVVPSELKWGDVIEFMAHNSNIDDAVFRAQTLTDRQVLSSTSAVGEGTPDSLEIVLAPHIRSLSPQVLRLQTSFQLSITMKQLRWYHSDLAVMQTLCDTWKQRHGQLNPLFFRRFNSDPVSIERFT